MYVAYFVETPTEFAQTAERASHRARYAEYVANIPWWAIAVGIIAAIARFFGALSLLLRRTWAIPLYEISAAFFLLALYRAFVLAKVGNIMSGGHVSIEVVFLFLSGFAIWYSFRQKSKGVLR